MALIDLVVLDMAGTTIKDENEVEDCFWQAAEETGLNTTRERIVSMMGWSKKLVFQTLWKEQLSRSDDELIRLSVENSYTLFTKILEHHYQTQEVLPSKGCMELMQFLKNNGIKIALTTGFYRHVTDIILHRLGWDKGLTRNYTGDELINASVTSDQVILGRPAPFMIFKAMELCGVIDVRKVVKIGDTPSDLSEGKNAGCLSFGILNGTHTRAQLTACENDGLMEDLDMFRSFLGTLC
jgi:phosphonatase-like hydrolase